jgi:hypothetical protein
MRVEVHYDDPRVIALVNSGVSREALASLLIELRQIVHDVHAEGVPYGPGCCGWCGGTPHAEACTWLAIEAVVAPLPPEGRGHA